MKSSGNTTIRFPIILSRAPTGISVKVVAPNILGDCFKGKARDDHSVDQEEWASKKTTRKHAPCPSLSAEIF